MVGAGAFVLEDVGGLKEGIALLLVESGDGLKGDPFPAPPNDLEKIGDSALELIAMGWI